MTITTNLSPVKEIIFLVEEATEGGYIAQALGESIFTEADTLEELKTEIRDAVHCHFPDAQNRPQIIRLHIVRDEVIAS
ncbi:2-oxoisovalerate dehydrogenase [Geminocystis sp. CENA526]|uniref:2-oxoisovalerate dehydrogenase n=1 Tax=Geminocystis sp. CENA526 TaxID=1355871 RepID=UPI003D6F51F2